MSLAKISYSQVTPPVQVWVDESGQDVVVAYGEARATQMPSLDRDKAVLIARARLAAYLGRTVIGGSIIIKEWRRYDDQKKVGVEIVAIKWSEASAQSAADLGRRLNGRDHK